MLRRWTFGSPPGSQEGSSAVLLSENEKAHQVGLVDRSV